MNCSTKSARKRRVDSAKCCTQRTTHPACTLFPSLKYKHVQASLQMNQRTAHRSRVTSPTANPTATWLRLDFRQLRALAIGVCSSGPSSCFALCILLGAWAMQPCPLDGEIMVYQAEDQNITIILSLMKFTSKVEHHLTTLA